jgi:NB-ARC domain
MSGLPAEFVRAIALRHDVTKFELEVLLPALEGDSIKTIAKEKQLEEAAVRKRLGKVYDKFVVPWTGPGKLAKLEQMLISEYLAQKNQNESAISRQRNSWEDAPDLTAFFGRQLELKELKRWVVDDRCRFVAILGMAGIGKTTLAVKLAQEVLEQFDGVIWRSLRYPVPLEQLIADIMLVVDRDTPPESTPPGRALGLPDQLTKLMGCLRKTRYLLVLDGVTSIQESGDFAGNYKPDYKVYGEFFQRLAEERHQSCLVITSQDKPREVALLEAKGGPVQILKLEGLKEDAASEILKLKGLSGQTSWAQLIRLYRGNPLALKMISVNIDESFMGDVDSFFKQGITLVLRDIRALLDQQFNRLSPLEQSILYWLAIFQRPVILRQLQDLFAIPIPDATLLDALASLNQRSLLEQSAEGFTLQPAVMEYITDKLVATLYDEILMLVQNKFPDSLRPTPDYQDTTQPESNSFKFLASYSIKPSSTKAPVHPPQLLSMKLINNLKGLLIQSNNLQKLTVIYKEINSLSVLEIGYFAQNLHFILDEVSPST